LRSIECSTFRTLTQFHGTEIYITSIFHGIGIFLLSFSVSMALGVAFGLAMSLLLKHSYLSLYPSIESCLVALCAYTCYFFSNGLSMSGIVSLLFCGITLKHYAYHTMSRRTQRTSKYIFATLAQLSENFIFIYLGMSLFTSAPTSERVFSYVKPIFIIIATVAVIFTRYASVFPLSEGINFFHKHIRGQRAEELPHSYQMMLFWAGLRGAVGVALAAGFKGDNAQTLRTTVLVVVVLTVVLFGGTTARMLEVLGIRTGVEDDGASSSEEEDAPFARSPWLRRSFSNSSGRWGGYADDDLAHQQRLGMGAARVGSHYATRSYNHHAQSPLGQIFSASSSESLESSPTEVLPMASAPAPPNNSSGAAYTQGTTSGQAPAGDGEGEDGKWFQALDERYLLPLFSNATASRTFHARKARRSLGQMGSTLAAETGNGTPDSEDEGQELELGPGGDLESSRVARGLPSPILRSSSTGENRSSS
jgi:sodium/hydrogen exchanger-like protein 6/7